LFGDGEWCAGEVSEMLSAEVLTRLFRHPVGTVSGPHGMLYFPA
jgi:hypothetical protein